MADKLIRDAGVRIPRRGCGLEQIGRFQNLLANDGTALAVYNFKGLGRGDRPIFDGSNIVVGLKGCILRTIRDVIAPSTSTPFGAKYASILRALCHLSKDQRIAVSRKAASGLIKCICECALNILNGNIPLNDYEKRKLRKYAGVLRKLIIPSGTWNSKRVGIIRKIAEFLPTLLLPLLKYFSEEK
ncbi:hypothetical protein QAD02_002665 [Eretmocerus hayati]|uniref:Uncharacterized protein n=1 Tax=Eretmocerus hayati TaxID=131215 RepID=A0ACC2NJY6_9HYME|nr:hypothetical protein QAD02_002665 [Eretmocerus hayati]